MTARIHLLGGSLVAASFLSLWACGSSSSGGDGGAPPTEEEGGLDGGSLVNPEGGDALSAPTVIATTPANGASGEPKDFPALTATFSAAMDPASIGPSSFIVSAGNTGIGGAITFEGQTAKFTPTVPFTVGETFKATLTTAVKDASGRPLAADYSWSFSTTSDFGIQVPEFTVQSGQETYVCYYFRTPNDRAIALASLSSSTQGLAEHLAVVLTSGDLKPPGTVSGAECFVTTFGETIQGAPIYGTHNATDTLTFPSDDGTGKPVAMMIPANQAGYVRIRVVNPTDAAVKVSATLTAKTLPTGTAYTRTAPYIASNAQIDVPANAVNDVETRSCDVPAGAKFWRVTTHTHNRAVSASVLDGAVPLVVTNDWEAPAVAVFTPPAFRTFSSGKLTYSCTYTNPGPRRLSGLNPSLDEACMALTYYFPVAPTPPYLPALGARFCLNDGLLQ